MPHLLHHLGYGPRPLHPKLWKYMRSLVSRLIDSMNGDQAHRPCWYLDTLISSCLDNLMLAWCLIPWYFDIFNDTLKTWCLVIGASCLVLRDPWLIGVGVALGLWGQPQWDMIFRAPSFNHQTKHGRCEPQVSCLEHHFFNQFDLWFD